MYSTKQTYVVILVIAFSAYCLQSTFAKTIQVIDDIDTPIQHEKSSVTLSESTVTIPGRVHCDFIEATEDIVCQEHCIPKGYTYGICVSHTCSCI